ncbi:hypothetical protein ACIPXV_09175 [Streptomyces libani]|uniref:hypothetical protein n=1 Tax=Streptomyces nigrescens TaxID=1920 RepID=UPI003812AE2E
MITISEHTLSRLFNQTKPHVAERSEAEAVQILVFDYDGTHLHAWATNRYTLAVARTKAEGSDEPWTVVVERKNLPDLQAAIRLLDKKPIAIEKAADRIVLSGETGTRIGIELSTSITPLNWRKIVHPALDRKANATPMDLNPSFFGAWKGLPGPVSMWSTGENQVSLVLAADFIGLQMPVRRSVSEDAHQRELDSWRPAKTAALAAAA